MGLNYKPLIRLKRMNKCKHDSIIIKELGYTVLICKLCNSILIKHN